VKRDIKSVVPGQGLVEPEPPGVAHLIVEDQQRLAGAAPDQLQAAAGDFNHLFGPGLRSGSHGDAPFCWWVIALIDYLIVREGYGDVKVWRLMVPSDVGKIREEKSWL
jgi:hypothetical protein